MIRHHIRQYLHKIRELLDAKDAPHSVAGGAAIGVFFGFLPAFGYKILGALGVARLTRCSVVAAAIGVTIHDCFWPIWPLVLRWQFQLGFWILSNPHHFAPKLHRGDFKFSEILQWDSFIDIGLPLAIGGVIFAIPISILSYGIILAIMRNRAARRQIPISQPEV